MSIEDRLSEALHQAIDREEPSPGLEARVVAALPGAHRRRLGWGRPAVPYAAVLAAVVLVAAIIVVPLGLRGTLPTPSGSVASGSATASATSSATALATPSATSPPPVPLTSLTWTQDDATPFALNDGITAGTSWSGGYILVGVSTIWRSTNGFSWERISDPHGAFDGAQIFDVTARGSTVVIVGRTVQTTSTPPVGLIWTSQDGISWHRVADPNQVIGKVAYLGRTTAGPAGFVAYGRDSTESAILYSADGERWERDAAPEGMSKGDSVGSITATSDGFAAVGSHAPPPLPSGAFGGDPGAAAAWWSADGRTWHASDVGSGGHLLATVQPWIGGLRATGLSACGGCVGPPLEWRSADAGRTWRQLPASDRAPVWQSHGARLVDGRVVELFVDYSASKPQTSARWTTDDQRWRPLAMSGAALPDQAYLQTEGTGLLIAIGSMAEGQTTRMLVFVGELR